jgi:hypothetical protein
MRGLRSFIVLLVVAIAFGSYLYFYESKQTPGAESEPRDKVFAVEADQIEEVTIKAESGQQTTLKKAGSDWQVVAPVTADADDAEAPGIARNLATLEQQRVVEENPGDLKDFGLAEPRISVTFKAGGQEHTLLIGSKTPTGSDIYAKTGAHARVFLISSFLESTFNRTTFDLRDKSALNVDREAADRVEIVAGTHSMTFARKDGQWRITEPMVPRADPPAVEGLVSRLDGVQMKKIVTQNADDLKQYGLDKPAATVRVGAGSAEATLLIGSKAEDGDVYAKDSSRPDIFTIEATLLEDLQKGAGEFRQKDIFDARAFNTTRVEITRAGQTTVIEKAEDKWRHTAPAAKDSDSAKVDALLSALTSARAEAFVEATPAKATQEAAVTLKFDDGKEERVSFFRSGEDAFAVRADTPGAAKFSASVLDSIVKAIDEAK